MALKGLSICLASWGQPSPSLGADAGREEHFNEAEGGAAAAGSLASLLSSWSHCHCPGTCPSGPARAAPACHQHGQCLCPNGVGDGLEEARAGTDRDAETLSQEMSEYLSSL